MYNETEASDKSPIRLAIAVVSALTINVAMGSAILRSGIDQRAPVVASLAPAVVADLGRLPVINVEACRTHI